MDNVKNIKLSQYSSGAGWACKLSANELTQVLSKLNTSVKNEKTSGFENFDDCAIYKINEKQSIIQTVDFFTPIVDDPYAFGEIAAANSLSDIYAMGGVPLFALNITAFPSSKLSLDILVEILRGGKDKCEEANINIFTKVNIPEQYKCINIYTTSIHSIFLIETGEILYCGNNSYLNKDPCSTPILIKNLPEPIIDVYTTVSMTYFKSVSKQLYISGIHNTHDFQIDSMLKINLMLEPNYIVEQVELKSNYCIIVLNNGNIYYSGCFHEYTSIYSEFKKLNF